MLRERWVARPTAIYVATNWEGLAELWPTLWPYPGSDPVPVLHWPDIRNGSKTPVPPLESFEVALLEQELMFAAPAGLVASLGSTMALLVAQQRLARLEPAAGGGRRTVFSLERLFWDA